jgi:hypothetical protein
MNMKSSFKRSWLLSLFLSVSVCLLADPSFVTSTFDSGSEGWQPWATSDVNGLSPGNSYLNITADGEGVFGKMITFNINPEWTGDYYSAGVNGIWMDIANMSVSDTVYLRIALGNRASPQQTGGTWFISQSSIVIPTLSSWTNVFLPLMESDLTVVGNLSGEMGTDSYADTFSDIQNIRILSAAIPLGAIGDEFVGDVGIDNVALVPEPGVLSMVGAGLITLALCRRRRSDKVPQNRRHRTYRRLDTLLQR